VATRAEERRSSERVGIGNHGTAHGTRGGHSSGRNSPHSFYHQRGILRLG